MLFAGRVQNVSRPLDQRTRNRQPSDLSMLCHIAERKHTLAAMWVALGRSSSMKHVSPHTNHLDFDIHTRNNSEERSGSQRQGMLAISS